MSECVALMGVKLVGFAFVQIHDLQNQFLLWWPAVGVVILAYLFRLHLYLIVAIAYFKTKNFVLRLQITNTERKHRIVRDRIRKLETGEYWKDE